MMRFTYNDLSEFAKSHGCTATYSEIRDFFIRKCQGEGELDDDAVESVSGGSFDFSKWTSDLFNSIFGGAGNSTNTGSTSSPAKNSIVGGGIVNVSNAPTDKSKIVGKGIAPATGTLSKDSIYKKL